MNEYWDNLIYFFAAAQVYAWHWTGYGLYRNLELEHTACEWAAFGTNDPRLELVNRIVFRLWIE